MSLEKRLKALEAVRAPRQGEVSPELVGHLTARIEQHLPAGTLPVRVQELLCVAIARRPAETPHRVIEALIASPELGEEHKDLLKRRLRGEPQPWPKD